MDNLSTKQQQQRRLQKLLRRPDLWRGESSHFARTLILDTGHSQLNRLLVKPGWPLKGLIEILQNQTGQGEWQLLSKGLNRLLKESGYIILINPPALLHLPGLQQLNLDHRRFLIIQTKNRANLIYSCKTAAASAACVALMCWETDRLSYTELRKLQLSAAKGSGLFILFRHSRALAQNSPACLRLSSRACADGFDIQICKQRGAFGQQSTSIAIPKQWLALPALSSPVWLAESKKRSGQRWAINQAGTKKSSAQVLPFNKQPLAIENCIDSHIDSSIDSSLHSAIDNSTDHHLDNHQER